MTGGTATGWRLRSAANVAGVGSAIESASTDLAARETLPNECQQAVCVHSPCVLHMILMISGCIGTILLVKTTLVCISAPGTRKMLIRSCDPAFLFT